VIDLHLHTTASDGRLTPAALVARAASAGISTLAVTDHDTIAGLAVARAAASDRGLSFVNGIEITAIEEGRDVHVLGYFFDPGNAALEDFLGHQRLDRVRRVEAMAGRLAAAGYPVDVAQLLEDGTARGRSIGRPHVAEALMVAGHVASRDEAFERFLGYGRPAFVPRRGATVADVVAVLATAGGIASLAHPGLTRVDKLIPSFATAGLAALEVLHSDHDADMVRRYRALAQANGLAVSGGSDFHAEDGDRGPKLGQITMSSAEFHALEARRR
jgi:predicted metal-dependent phosphoesterase TrpH